MQKTIVITSYDMTKFYGAGIFQTTIAYATAFKKLGYDVKMLLAHGVPTDELKVDPKDKLVWMGLEYISVSEFAALPNVDYLIYMGSSDVSIEEGGTGLYEITRDRWDNAKIVYASFYNILAGLIDGLTDCNGYLSVAFGGFSKSYDEVWVLDSHNFGNISLLEKTFKKVKAMPLLVMEAEDYIHEYHNNTVPPIIISAFKYDVNSANRNVILNLDPNSKFKNAFFSIVGSLDWLRAEPNRHISIGNAYPLWTASDHKKYDAIYTYFNRYMRHTLTPLEYHNMAKQNDESLIWFYDRHPIGDILNRVKPFAVVITDVAHYFERWNVLIMDLFRMGVPVIHNFPEIKAGWHYDFPDAKSLDAAIKGCHKDLFTHGMNDQYRCKARSVFNWCSGMKDNLRFVDALLHD